jgi:hypothetical protein
MDSVRLPSMGWVVRCLAVPNLNSDKQAIFERFGV